MLHTIMMIDSVKNGAEMFEMLKSLKMRLDWQNIQINRVSTLAGIWAS